MPEIIDIIHKLSYEVNDAELVQATKEVQANLNNIAALTQAQRKLEAELSRTARSEIQKRREIKNAIDNTKRAIDNQTKSLEQNITSNKKLHGVISQEIGLIGRLQMQMDTLKKKRDIATDVTKIRAYTSEIGKLQAQQNALLTNPKSIFSGFGGALLQGVGIGTGIGLFTQAIGGIQSFISESSKLGAEMEGVSVAFARLNKPDLLDNLRAATKGTVSDLELMKNAIQFSNFGLPVDKLATALQFARIRAKETGQSVDYLVQSITTGIGRQSPLILDNLGINARRVREEFQRTGDFAEAAFKIIQEESAKAGKDLDTFAEKQARLNAQIENAQAGFGQFFNKVQGGAFEFLRGFFTGGNRGAVFAIENYIDALRGLNSEIERAQGLLGGLPKTFPRKKFDARNTTLADIGTLTGEEIDALLEKVENAQKLLDGSNEAEIKRLAKLKLALENQKNFLSGADYKKSIDEEKKNAEERRKLYDELIRSLRELRREYDATAIAQSKVAPEEPLVLPGDENDLFKNRKDPGTGVVDFELQPLPEAEAEALNIAARRAKFQAEEDRRKKADREKQKQINKERVREAIEAEQAIFDAFLTINAAKQRLLDLEYERQSERVRQAEFLAERGNAEELKAEQDKLAAIQSEREKAARQQIQINALLQASNAAVALSEAIGAIVKTASQGDPYTIAFRIAAAVAALVAGIASLKTAFQGFAEGGYTGDGDKHAPAGVVHKGEFVITKERTAQYRPLLEAIHEGKINPMAIYQSSAVNNSMDTRRIEQGLAEVKEAVEMNKVNVKQVMDMYGLTQSVESYQNKQRKLWQR